MKDYFEEYTDDAGYLLPMEQWPEYQDEREPAHKPLRFPLKFDVEDFSGSTRGQGKRVNGMVTGAMSARVGKSSSINVGRTFGLADEDKAEVECMNQWEFNVYRRQREAGDDHHTAATAAFTECNP